MLGFYPQCLQVVSGLGSFINAVDEFYDRGVKLVITAETPIEDLYAGGRLDFEFERTRSRLLEMQSQEYLAREHLA